MVEGPSRVEGFGVAVTTLVASLRAAKVSLEAVYAEVPPARIKNKMGVPMAAQKAEVSPSTGNAGMLFFEC